MEEERIKLKDVKHAYLGGRPSLPENETRTNKSKLFNVFHAENKFEQKRCKGKAKATMRLTSDMLEEVHNTDVFPSLKTWFYPLPPQGTFSSVKEVINTNNDYYIKFANLNFQAEERVEIRSPFTYDEILKDKFAVIACSLLNTGEVCSLFYGLNTEGRVWGLHLGRKKKHRFLHYVSCQMRRIVPIVLPISYEVIFTPVFKNTEVIDLKCERIEVVVEVRLSPVPGVLYSLNEKHYLRAGTMIYEASPEEVDEWVLAQEAKLANLHQTFGKQLLEEALNGKCGH